MTKKIFLLIATTFLLLGVDCKDEPPIKDDGKTPQPVITLIAEDIGVTEVWLTLKTQNVTLPSSVTLQRNNATLTTFTLTTNDTLLVDTTAQPKQNYTYSAILQSDSSNQLQVTTMDTTSHNFTWQTFTFGGETGTGSSILYDVAIVNDTLAYAVGEIVLKDSVTGEIDPQPYSLLKWNGKTWELKKLFFNDNSVLLPRGIFVVSPNDIWFAAGSIFRWDGQSDHVQLVWARDINQNATIEKLWGSSSTDMYGVGTLGLIVHYNGTSWSKIESGTSATIQDIYGSTETQNNEPLILCSVSNLFDLGDMKILRLHNQTVEEYYVDTERRISSVWFRNEKKIFRTGGGVFIRKYNKAWFEVVELPLYYTERTRGIADNDIFIVGDFGLVSHYNGMNWQIYPEANQADIFRSCDYNGKTIIVAGYNANKKAVIIIGTHN